jgi:hypothetical protein
VAVKNSLGYSCLICPLALLVWAGWGYAQDEPTTPLPPGAIQRLGSPDSHWSAVSVLRFSPDGKWLASRSQDDRIRFWSLETGKVLATVPQQDYRIKSMEFTQDSKGLVTTDCNSPGKIWNVADGSLRETLKFGGKIVRVFDGDRIGIAGPSTYFVQKEAGEFSEARFGAEPIALSRTGSRLATYRPNAKQTEQVPLFLWDAQIVKQLTQLPGLKSPPYAAVFSPNANYLAAVGWQEPYVMVWDLVSKKARQLSGHEQRVLAINFSSSGRFLATAGRDRTVCIWETLTGKKLATLKGHRGSVLSLAFSRDGRRLATGASGRQDNSTLIWDMAALTTPGEVPANRPEGDDLLALWDNLADEDPHKAYAKVGVLVEYPEAAYELLDKQLSPHLRPANPGQIEKLIGELGSLTYVTRCDAERNLIRLRVMADTRLRQTLATTDSVEVRYRIKRILRSEAAVSTLPRSERLRMSRVVHALSLLDGEKANQLLDDIASGHEALEVMQDAASVRAGRR